MEENSEFDKKSLRFFTKSNPDWDELAKDCVSFANATGGRIIIGIENDMELPPENQFISNELLTKVTKQIQSRTINVSILTRIEKSSNNSEYIEILIQRNATSIASTSNGRYYIRVNDECKPVLPDELIRLMNDRSAFIWETNTHLKVPRTNYDLIKFQQFVNDIKLSDRVSSFVKNKSNDELLEYYYFVSGNYLTSLGILWIGKREHRAKLLYAPCIQFLKWDENGQRVFKRVWDDYYFNPKELMNSVWEEIPDWKEGIEVADGIFRKVILNYDETVVRELLANALVHRAYTIRGDIFINLYFDKLEIHNPGLLPLGVTPQNILHKSIQRNQHLAKVFYDLKLMEKEGSGYDRMYETLLSQAKPLPVAKEDNDRVVVTIYKRIINKQIISFIDKVHKEFQLNSKELISLGLIAQYNALTAIEFSKILGIDNIEVQYWLGRLLGNKLIKSRGKTKGTTYYIESEVLKKHKFKGKTSLRKIETPRLKHLIIADLEIYEKSSIGEIHQRIGKEIPRRTIKSTLDKMIQERMIIKEGIRRFTKYSINKNG